MLYAIIGMLVIIADQYIKFWVQGHIALTSTGEEFIPGILSLANVHNDGAAFGFLAGSGARIPFIILAGVFTVAVIIALATKLISGKLARWSIVMVTAGALSNCLDRVLYGYVQDMFKLEFINFPVFNLADVFITVFAILFALAVIFGKTRRDDDDDYEFEDDEEEEEEIRRPARKKQKRSKRRASRYEDEDEEEDEDDEEDEEPVRARKQKKQKRSRRAAAVEEEDEDEEEEEPVRAPARRTAQQPARPQRAAATAARPTARAKAVDDEDPFAGWERSSAAKATSAAKPATTAKPVTGARQRTAGAAASTPAARPAARPAASAQTAQARTTQRSTATTAAAPAKQPTARPAAKPAPKPAVEEEFSLDDILNEFR